MFLTKILILLIIKETLQSSISSPTYEAGVVEFNVGTIVNKTSSQLLKERLDQYLDIMERAPSNLDIIVFPESTLNTMLTAPEIPEPSENITPCNDGTYEDESLIKQISCSAKKHKRYVVINITTKSKCPDAEMIANGDPRNCTKRNDGFSYYNTNVVFDRNGTVISRYRKYNLFGESVDKPYKPSMETFTTDFGVKFGHFICFDLMFRYPALDLVWNYDLTDIIFTTMWFSELPYLTAVQVQQNWAYSNNVNLIAAGANNVRVGSTGSGIYGGKKGAYVSDMAAVSKSKLHTATVYKIKDFPQNENIRIEHNVENYTKEELKNLFMKRDQLDVYNMDFLNDTDGAHYQEKNICQNGVCCNIKVNYNIRNSNMIQHYQYALAFYHGNRTFDGYADGGVIACTILACQTNNITSCGIRKDELENIHIWNSIEIEAELPTKNGQYFYMPNSLDLNITPLQPETFDYEVTDLGNDKNKIKMKLNSHAPNLITFGIYGRDFNLDENSGVFQKTSSFILIAFLFISFFIIL